MGQSQFIPVINQLIPLSYACTPLYFQECLLIWIVSDLQSLWKDSCMIIISSFVNSKIVLNLFFLALITHYHHLLLGDQGFLNILLKIS